MCFSLENEEEAQKKSRELDPKIEFDFSYVEPPVPDEDDASEQDQAVKV